MKDHGYTGIMYPHPNFYKQACDFKENELITVYDKIAPYTKAFNESALMITDYSSVAMDFAYLRKPIVYTQFDYEEFYAAHTVEEGYFDFEKNGFGPVCYDYESAVREIIAQINADCVEPDIYRQRIDGFFSYNDDKSCERIFTELERMSDQ
jgi:CDP-glycerol glycerophosphotransferase (TagB/SpsB family)